MKNYKLLLRPVEDNDIGQIEEWLNKEYIKKWYHDPEDWLLEIRERNGEFSFLSHFMVLHDEKPIGFCQYYDCFYAGEDWYSVSRNGEKFSIDYLIGEEEYLGKGYGKAIVAELLQKMKKGKDEFEIVVQPDLENVASCKALESNGFIFYSDKGYWSKMR